ncbi:MAG: hypothetical protein ACJ74J_12540 [Blastocatellia bacterium]
MTEATAVNRLALVSIEVMEPFDQHSKHERAITQFSPLQRACPQGN